MSDIRKTCDWPEGEFKFVDSPGEHDPCYVVMPGGAMLALNHNAGEGVDIARAKFIIAACNEKLSCDAAELLAALEDIANDQDDCVSPGVKAKVRAIVAKARGQ